MYLLVAENRCVTLSEYQAWLAGGGSGISTNSTTPGGGSSTNGTVTPGFNPGTSLACKRVLHLVLMVVAG